jgi:hypothetical protein
MAEIAVKKPVIASAAAEFSAPSPAELQERHLEALEICADWKESLQRRQQRLLLRSELIGGVTDDEVEQLKEDAEMLRHCMAVLAWRPRDDS